MLGVPSRPVLATKLTVDVTILGAHLVKTAMPLLLLPTGPNRSNEVSGSPTGVVPRRWVLAAKNIAVLGIACVQHIGMHAQSTSERGS